MKVITEKPNYILKSEGPAPFLGNDGIDKFLSSTLDATGSLVTGSVDAVTGSTQKELAKQQSGLQQTVVAAQIDAQKNALQLELLNQQRLALAAQSKSTGNSNILMYVGIGLGVLLLLGGSVMLILNSKN